MPYLADRVQETTTTTGTGAVTLGGAVAGYQSFATAYPIKPCKIAYLLVSGNSWEVGKGELDAAGTTITRDAIRSSSNNGSLITLSGTSNVYVTASAELLDNSNTGMQYAMSRGFGLP